jgi:hypothetical protein
VWHGEGSGADSLYRRNLAPIDACAEALSRQRYGTHSSRAEIIQLAAFDCLKVRRALMPEPKAIPEAVTGKKGRCSWNSI